MKEIKEMRSKVLLISLVLSLPFWWGMNVLAENLQDSWFEEELNRSLRISNRYTEELKLEKELQQRFKDLEINAKAAILVKVNENGDERILFEKDSQKPLAIASLTKLMTALVVFDLDEVYTESQPVKITKEAVEQEGQSKYGELEIGESLSVKNLLYIALIESSNDAAFALTEPIGKQGFVELMNLYSKKIELENTYFVNPTGLEPDRPEELKNFSTAKDIVRLTKYILENYPQIFEITTNQSYEVLSLDNTLHHFIPQNTNELLREIPEIIGGKTGWGIEAGGCLLLVLDNPEEEGSYFVSIVLGAKDRFAETHKFINALK